MKKILTLLLITILTLFMSCSQGNNSKKVSEVKNTVYYCDKCFNETREKTKFCPNCGEQCKWLLTKEDTNKSDEDNKREVNDTEDKDEKDLTKYTAEELYNLYSKEELKKFYYDGKLSLENLPQAYANEIIHEQEVYYCDNCNNITDRSEIALNGGVCNACKDRIAYCKICGTRILEKDNYNDGYCSTCTQYKDECHDCGAITTERAIVSYFPEVGYSLCPYCQLNHICSNCFNFVDYLDPTMKTCYKCTEEINSYYSEVQSQASYSCNNCLGCTHTTSDIPEGTPCSYCGANSGYTKRDVCHCFDW